MAVVSFMIYHNVYNSFTSYLKQLQRLYSRNCLDIIPLAFVLTIVNALVRKRFLAVILTFAARKFLR